MFENFNTIDFLILGILCLMNVISLILVIYLAIKNKQKSILLEEKEEIKVTKVNEEKEPIADYNQIIEAMQKDIESEKESAVELFEQEQEEKAIISYQELLNVKNNKEAKPEPKLEIKPEIKPEPVVIPDINVDEILEKASEKPKATPKLVTTPETKFTNSEFVSPVFGKMDSRTNIPKLEKEQELEKTLDLGPISEEIRKNNEFLNALKEFRRSL